MRTVEDAPPITPTETSNKDRRDLWASITVFAATALVVVVNYVVGLLDDLEKRTVTARFSFEHTPPPNMFSPNGTPVSFAGTSNIDIPTGAVSPVTVGFLRSADALETIGYLAVLALLTWVMVRFVRGRLFDKGVIRGVTAASVAAVITIIAPTFPRVLGSNLAIRDLAWDDGVGAQGIGPEFWYAYVFCMALSAVAVVLRIGSRVARDNEGLV